MTEIWGIKMLGDDRKHFLIVRVEPSALANDRISAKAKVFYEQRMGDRIVLVAENPTDKDLIWKVVETSFERLNRMDLEKLVIAAKDSFPGIANN